MFFKIFVSCLAFLFPWHQSQAASQNATDFATYPQVAYDSSGNAYAFWHQYDGNINSIRFATKPNGGAWNPPETVSSLSEESVNPRAAIDSAGTITLIWSGFDGANKTIKTAYKLSGQSWSSPTILATASGISSRADNADLAIDGSDTLTAIWIYQTVSQGVVQNSELQSSLKFSGQNWTAPSLLSDSATTSADRPNLALDSSGNARVVYEIWDGSYKTIQTNSRTAGQGWISAPQVVSNPAQNGMYPEVKFDGTGKAYAAWCQLADALNPTSICFSALPSGGASWSSPVKISDLSTNALDPELSVDPSGNAYVLYAGVIQNNTQIMFTGLPSGGVWSAPLALSDGTTNAEWPESAVDAAGNLFAAWTRNDGMNDRAEIATRTSGGVWSPLTELSSAGVNGTSPEIAIDSTGNATVVWFQSDATGNNSYVYASTRPAGGSWSAAQIISN